MKWINSLREKFATRPASPTKPAKPAPAEPAIAAEDSERLRLMLAACSDQTERGSLIVRLGTALTQSGQTPRADDLPDVWSAAICQATDKTQAQAWLTQMNDEAGLTQVAMRARSAEIRYAAARRIETDALLEQVAQASRDKDKRVHRHCADLLRQRRQAEASARQANEISAELQGLPADAPLPLSRLLALKQTLSSLEFAGEAGLQCEALMHQAFTRLHQESELLRDLHTQQAAAAALAVECSQAVWPWQEQVANWQVRATSLARFQAALPPWLNATADARALGVSLQQIETCLAALADDQERVSACDAFLTALENTSADTPLATEAAASWEALAKPEHAASLASVMARWQTLSVDHMPAAASIAVPIETTVAEPEPPRKPERSQPKFDQQAINDLLDTLEQSIEQGHLIDADASAKKIKAALGKHSLHGRSEARLHQLQAQLETLRGWAKWGTGQAREQLIASATALLNGEHDTGALALAISALRESWKRLDAHGAASKEQWERFDTTLEQAYLPVAAHRAEVAERQAEARTAKEMLCTSWENEFAEMAWEQADFKAVEARRAELLQQWRAAPQAGFRHERQLRKHFDPLIARIDQHLETARSTETERREQLIAAAETLIDHADLGRAMAEAKALQTRWNQQPAPVRLKRSVEDKLWQRFRAACNAVFARRDAQRAEQSLQQQARTQVRQKLLDAFAAILKQGESNAIKQALTQFSRDWETGGTGARDSVDSLENQARDLQKQAQQLLAAQIEAKKRAHYELLALKAALAGRVEAAALAQAPLDTLLADTRQAWDSLQTLPGKEENLLAQRFAAADSLTREAAEANHAAREELLLDLEIALSLPSPEAFVQARRERQLERLQHRFGAAEEQVADTYALLVKAYAMSAPPDATFEQRIAAIVQYLARQGSST